MSKTIRSTFLILLFFAIWQAVIVVFRLPSYILPSPLQVICSFINYRQLIMMQTLPTLLEMLAGLSFSILLGTGLAFMMCSFRMVYSLLRPLLLISQTLPIFAIAPLLVIWFGYGTVTKVTTITLMLFFPITSNFLDGLKQTPQAYLDSARLMGGNRWQVLYHIRAPAALPHLASGIRLATAMAPLAAVISEWIGANQGLGFLLLRSNAQMQIDLMFATLWVLILLSLFMYYFIGKLSYFTTPWL